MFIERHDVALAVAADGTGTFFSKVPVSGGLIRQVLYTPDGTSPLDTGADLTITAEDTGLPIATLTNIGTSVAVFAPRLPTCSLAGAANLYAAGGAAVDDLIALVGERIKVTVAQGGNAKLGTLSVWVG